MTRNMTLGLSLLAGAALLEAAIVPALVIGGAAVLAPKHLPKFGRRLQKPLFKSVRQPKERAVPASPAHALPRAADKTQPVAASGFAIKRALAKTITFRIIVTSLDFSANYIVIGELATAAGLSAFSLAAGPVFYFIHEVAWDKYRAARIAVDLRVPGQREFTLDRALAKTITYRTLATTMDFTTNYVVVGDIATAVVLSAFGFVVGPFVYLGHERVWDRIAPASKSLVALSNPA